MARYVIVDDSPSIDDRVVRLLQSQGFRVVVAQGEAQEAPWAPPLLSNENPNPVLRVCGDGRVDYANPASAALLDRWHCAVGQPIPEPWRTMVGQVLADGRPRQSEVTSEAHVCELTLVPSADGTYLHIYGHDITERRRAEAALRERELRLSLAQRCVRLGYVEIDIVSGAIAWSDEVFELLGFEPQAFAPGYEDYIKYVHPEDAGALAQQITELITHYQPFQSEYRVVRPTDEVRWVVGWGEMLYDADDRPVRYLGILQDVTELKRANQALLAERTHLRTLVDTIPDMIWLKDPRGVYLACNPVFERFTGFREADLLGKADHEIFAPEVAESFRAYDRRAVLSGRPMVNEELVTFADDGHQALLETYKTPMYDTGGELVGVLGVARDITAAREAEDALRAEQERFANLAAVAPGAIHVYKLRPDGSSCFPYASPAIREIYGLAPEDLADDAAVMSHLVHPDDQAHVFATTDESARTMTPWRCEFRVAHPDKGEIWVEAHSMPAREPDGSILWYGFLTDITERKSVEATLEAERARLAERVAERTADLRIANAELARAARLKDEFLANMSHELRTPLNAILGRTELLQDELYGPVTARQIASLRSIDASGRHLLALINDILDLSKIESGKLDLQFEAVDVELVCQMSVHMVAQSALTKRIALSTRLDSQVQTICADERRLKQILVNLLSNAVKFTPEGGQVGLEVSGEAQGQTVTFVVWDTGIGIADEYRSRLFQPFTQIDSGLNRQYAGTGLGLSLVLRLAQAHQGSVTVDSAPGQGSRFSVTLPWHSAQDEPDEAKGQATGPALAREGAPGQSLGRLPGQGLPLVLLVDDNEDNNQVVEEYLDAHGYEVVLARNGLEALAQIEAARPAIVLMDIQMPDMDGLEATRRIRADARMGDMPIIALTALAMPGDRERCLAAGADDYLTKPVSLRSLLASIETHLRRRRGQHSGALDERGE